MQCAQLQDKQDKITAKAAQNCIFDVCVGDTLLTSERSVIGPRGNKR
jgi:hypothetical protein